MTVFARGAVLTGTATAAFWAGVAAASFLRPHPHPQHEHDWVESTTYGDQDRHFICVGYGCHAIRSEPR